MRWWNFLSSFIILCLLWIFLFVPRRHISSFHFTFLSINFNFWLARAPHNNLVSARDSRYWSALILFLHHPRHDSARAKRALIFHANEKLFFLRFAKKKQHRATVVKWRREDSEGTLRRGVFGAHIKAMDQHGEESVMERRWKASAYVDIKWLFFALFSAAFIMLYLPSPPVDDDDRAATLSSASCDSLMCLRALVESFHVSDETHFGMTKATMRWGENKSQNNIENMIRFIFIALFTVIVFSPSHTIKRVARVSFFFNLFGGNAVRLLLWSVMGVMWCGGGRRHLEFDFYTGKILHFRFFW